MTDKGYGGEAGTELDTDAQRSLRALADEIAELLKARGAGGALFLVSPEAGAWRFVIPDWIDVTHEGGVGAFRVRLKSSTPELRQRADTTMHVVGALRDMTGDAAILFDSVWTQVLDELAKQGVSVEHREHRIMPPNVVPVPVEPPEEE